MKVINNMGACMQGNKNLLLILTFILSIFSGGIVSADVVEDTCAQNTAGYYHGIPNTTANTGIIASYNNCVSEGHRIQQEQAQAPSHPGNPPVYNCSGSGNSRAQCEAEYQAAKAQYDANLAKYQAYQSGHPNMYTIKELSPAQILEDVAAKQQKTADRLQRTANLLKTIGTVMITVGTAILATGYGAAIGIALIVAGGALLIFGTVVQNKSNKIAREKVTTCEQLNKVLTKPVNCADVKEQVPVDGTFQVTDYGVNGTGGTSDIPPFIDPTTGQCKAPVTPECQAIVKNAPKDCFKANSKGLSCMAGSKTKPAVTQLANGKISMNINGKQRTFGAEDFADEASMVKAGFTPAQAKQFLAMSNDPNSILAKNGLNAKGELKQASSSIPSASLSGGANNGGNGVGSMNMKKDTYGPPIESQEVARTPASAEGLTKDYHGDMIGAEGDNVFKMINRRYNLKKQQNIFIEQ